MNSKKSQRKQWGLYLIPLALLALTLLATHFASTLNATKKRDNFEARFSALTSQTTLLIQERLNRYPLLLKTTRGLVLNNLEQLHSAWPEYFRTTDLNYEQNGIIGITFTQYVDHKDLPNFLALQYELYGPGFYIFPDNTRSNYFILTQAAPHTISDKVRGFDIGSEPNRRFAAERAKNSSSLSLSAPVSLLPTRTNSLDYLFLLPVESPNPTERYTNTFHGWVTIGFSLSMMLEEVQRNIQQPLQIQAVDARAGLTPQFDSHPGLQANNDQKQLQIKQTLALSQQKIDLLFTPLPSPAFEASRFDHDLETLMGGGIISILSALACFLLLSGRDRALKLAHTMMQRSRDSNIRYQTLFESSPEAVTLCVDNKIILANSAALSLLGAKRLEDLTGLDILDIAHPDLKHEASSLLNTLINGESARLDPIEEKLARLDGTFFEAELNLSRTTYDGSTAIQLMFRDITLIKDRRNEAKIAKKVLEHTTEAIMVTDGNARIVLTNPAFTTLTGYNDKQIIDQKTNLLKSGHHDDPFYKQLWSSLLHSGQWTGELANRKRSGEVYIQKTNISAVYDKEGDISHFVCVMSDITEQKRTFDKIRFQALHDNLTKLPNRIHFEARAEKALNRARQSGSFFAVLFIDLDDFKPINDSYGHLLGDKLLVALADKLSSALRPSDMVSRIGGDEFLVLADELPKYDEATLLSERLMQMISSPITIDGIELRVSASIGISVYPMQGDNINTLIHTADQAMYRAKKQSKNQVPLTTSPEVSTEIVS